VLSHLLHHTLQRIAIDADVVIMLVAFVCQLVHLLPQILDDVIMVSEELRVVRAFRFGFSLYLPFLLDEVYFHVANVIVAHHWRRDVNIIVCLVLKERVEELRVFVLILG